MCYFLFTSSVVLVAFFHVSCSFKTDEQFKELVIRFSKNSKLQEFSWEDCGDSSYAAHFDAITILPDPIHLPGNLTVGGRGSLSRSIKSPIKAELVIKKKIIVWVEIPCIEHKGSCTYKDICELLHHLPCSGINDENENFSCQCPFNQGTYDIPLMTFDINDPQIPSELLHGQFVVNVNLSDNVGKIACLHSHFNIA